MRKRLGLTFVALLLSFGLGCGSSSDVIYLGGAILTVNGARPNAEAIPAKDGQILMVGSRADIEIESLCRTKRSILR